MDKILNMMKKWFSVFFSDKKHEISGAKSKIDLDDQWKNFFDHFPDFIIQTDRTGKILYMNRPFTRKTKEEMMGSNVMSHLPSFNPQILRARLESAFDEGRESILETSGTSKNEWFLVRIVPKRIEAKTDTVFFFLTKLSNTKLPDGDLFGISAFLSNEKETQKRVLTRISSEIRNPMQVILSYINLLKESSLNGEQKEAVENIDNSSKTLFFVLNEILDVSRIAAGQFSLKTEPFNLNEIVTQVVNVCRHDADEKGLSLQMHNFHLIVDTLSGDKERLKQVLFHLVNNAIKFSAKGKIDITCKLINQTGNLFELQICVQDTGMGMDNQHLEKIFKSFPLEDEKTSRQYIGLGLGLAISNHIIGLMGGKLEVTSEKEIGSRFVLTLTLERSNDQMNGISQVNYDINDDEVKRIKVLLVEDEVLQQKTLQIVFKNWNIAIAGNGKEAIETLEKNKDFDIILMDIRMPVMDGIEATKHIRSHLKLNIPIIAVSGEAFVESTLNECTKAGMNDFVSKPYEKSTLIDSLVRNIKNKPLTVKKKELNDFQRLEGKKVLFVEDNLINQKVTQIIFQKLGCKITIARDGKTAWQHIQNTSFDFFLLDLNLPDMSGFDVSKKIRESGIIAPVIAYSGDDSAETFADCITAGMDDLLVKPQKDFHEMGLRIFKIIEKVKNRKLYSLDSLINQIGNDGEQIKEMVSVFLTSVPIAIKKLSEAHINTDMKLLHATAHNLKTSTLSFGIRSVRGSLIRIEDYAKEKLSMEHQPNDPNLSMMSQKKETDIGSGEIQLLIKNVIDVLNQSCKQLEADVMNPVSVKNT